VAKVRSKVVCYTTFHCRHRLPENSPFRPSALLCTTVNCPISGCPVIPFPHVRIFLCSTLVQSCPACPISHRRRLLYNHRRHRLVSSRSRMTSNRHFLHQTFCPGMVTTALCPLQVWLGPAASHRLACRHNQHFRPRHLHAPLSQFHHLATSV